MALVEAEKQRYWKLICGLLIPSNGKIALFQNKEILKRDINNSELITYVPQEPYLVDSDFYSKMLQCLIIKMRQTLINLKKHLLIVGLKIY